MNLTPQQLQRVLRGEALSVCGFDLECTSLSASIGRVLCASFKPLGKPVYTLRGDDLRYRFKDIANDRRLVKAIRDELESYDIIVGHNSKMFDARFLEGRLLKHGERPRVKTLHVDTLGIIRSNARISGKLDNVQKLLRLPETKTPIDWDDWARAGAFDPKGMSRVVAHCEADVRVLEQAYLRLLSRVKEVKTG